MLLLLKKYKILLLLLAVAFAVRLSVILVASSDYTRFLTGDSHDYLYLANNIYQHLTYMTQTGSVILRVPGYSFFISLIWFITYKSLMTILIFQVLIDTGTCFLTWILFNKLFKNSKTSSYFAMTLQLFSVAAIVFTARILSETLFTFIFIFTLVILETAIAKKKKSTLCFFAGVTMALLCLVRVVALPLILPFAVYVWIRSGNIYNPVKFLFPIIMILGLWTVRNYYETDYLGLSTVGSVNLYLYNACALLAKQNNRSYTKQQQICAKTLSSFSTLKATADFSKNEGIRILKKDPLFYTYLHLKGNINTLLPAVGDLFNLFGYNIGGNGTLGIINTKGIYSGIKHYFNGKWRLFYLAIPVSLFLLFKYIGCLISLFALCTKKIKPFHFFYFLLIFYFILVSGPAATPRFRVPIEPLLAIYCVYGIKIIIGKLKKQKTRTLI